MEFGLALLLGRLVLRDSDPGLRSLGFAPLVFALSSCLTVRFSCSSQNLSLRFLRCTDTWDLGHFGPKTFRHYVFGAEMSHIFALVPKCPMDTSAEVSNGHFGTSAEVSLTVRH